MRRLAALAMLLCALAGPTSVLAADPPVRANLPDLEDEVMCPVCGTLLGLSHSPAAERERVYIRKLIKQGKTDDEIKDALVAEYGGQVLALPENRGIDVWAYAVPVIGLVLGALGAIWAIIAWRRRKPDDPPPSAEDAPTGEEAERLDRDMARFDL